MKYKVARREKKPKASSKAKECPSLLSNLLYTTAPTRFVEGQATASPLVRLHQCSLANVIYRYRLHTPHPVSYCIVACLIIIQGELVIVAGIFRSESGVWYKGMVSDLALDCFST